MTDSEPRRFSDGRSRLVGPSDMTPESARPTERIHLVDVGLALALAIFSIALLGLPYRQHLPGLPPFEVAAALTLATTLPLIVRRTWPEICVSVITIAYLGYVQLATQQISGPSLALWIALFSEGAYGRASLRRPVRALVVTGLLGFIVAHVVLAGASLGPDLPFVLMATVSYNAFIYGLAWLMGNFERQREIYERELDLRARALERDRVERERRVVRDERIRIARELHDVVAHHVSLMGIQAGAARTVLDRSPERTRDLLVTIEGASRRAVDEMHRLLSALRDEASPEAKERPPNLAQVEELIESARSAGLEATLSVRGQAPSDLPETVNLSAYRIVQEAITNIIRHAKATHAWIEIDYRADAIGLRIRDDGRGHDPNGVTGGRGLVGMQERAALFGGILRAGPINDRGFLVEAELPIAQPEER